jgi:hypothetical protein
MEETAWLIEIPMKSVGGPPMWWTGSWNGGKVLSPWTEDSLLAVRFCRKEDAEKVINGTNLLKDTTAVATEHIWG